ncbi:MAG: HAD family hydrolase [Nocardioidaceae bacterium]
MTNPDAAKQLATVLNKAGPILLDFDGPVTSLLPTPANAMLADMARRPLTKAGVSLPGDIARTSDHLAVLRFSGDLRPDLTSRVDTVCTAGEIEAAGRSTPTLGAHDAMRTLRRTGHPIVIVSNNATEAVETYLNRHRLDELVSGIVGRQHGQPELMKPDPEPIERALRTLGVDAASCVLIGDSVTDIEASKAVGLRSIGYAKTPERSAELSEAGADAVVDAMSALIAALT